jgi:Putative peptidoglycan binding domain
MEKVTHPKFPYSEDEFIDQHHHNGCHGGEDSKHVRLWQHQMQNRGWVIEIDGCFGPQSELIVKRFQARHGFKIDGKIGPRTWKASFTSPIVHGLSHSWRDKVAAWHDAHVGITEQPPGSNCDERRDGIRHAQDGCANGRWLRHEPWCGVWAWAGLHAAGITKVGDSFMASVATIEDRARRGQRPFRGWTTDGSHVKKGDLVVLFGRGMHVGTVHAMNPNVVYTWEGNTGPPGRSQTNGGGAYRCARMRHGQVHGYALVKGD